MSYLEEAGVEGLADVPPDCPPDLRERKSYLHNIAQRIVAGCFEEARHEDIKIAVRAADTAGTAPIAEGEIYPHCHCMEGKLYCN